MKKFVSIFSLAIVSIMVISCIQGVHAATTPIPDGYDPDFAGSLEYTVEDWNEASNLWWWSPAYIDRGHVFTDIGGKMQFDLSDWGDNDASSVTCENPIPYFDVNITKLSGEVNFTCANLSNSEIAIALGIGYMGFQPGLVVRSDDWDYLKSVAIAQSNVERSYEPGVYDNAIVSALSISGKVTYTFAQQTGMRQNTTLIYDEATGVLQEAITEMSGYWCDILLVGGSIPSFNIFGLLGFAIASIVAIVIIAKKKVNIR